MVILTQQQQLLSWGDNTDGRLGIGSSVNVGDSGGEMGDYMSTIDFGLAIYSHQFY